MESLCGRKSVDPDLLASSDLNQQGFQFKGRYRILIKLMPTVPVVGQICYSVSKQMLMTNVNNVHHKIPIVY